MYSVKIAQTLRTCTICSWRKNVFLPKSISHSSFTNTTCRNQTRRL